MGGNGAREGRAVTIRYDATVEAGAAGLIVRDARRRAGMSQIELGRRAGVTQSVVSAYESGRRQPSLPTLERLVRAAGLELDMAVRPAGPGSSAARGSLGERLARSGARVREIAGSYGLSNVRVFGSVARGEDSGDSDVDLLVDVGPGVGADSPCALPARPRGPARCASGPGAGGGSQAGRGRFGPG